MNLLLKYRDLAIFAPSIVIVLFIGRIPYVNLFAHEFITIALTITYIIWQSKRKLDFKSSMYLVLGLFVFVFIIDILGMHFYAEVVGNFIYILLIFTTIPILFRKA